LTDFDDLHIIRLLSAQNVLFVHHADIAPHFESQMLKWISIFNPKMPNIQSFILSKLLKQFP